MATADIAQAAYTSAQRAVLAGTRLIYVAPAAGCSGVGDYSADFAAGVAPHLKELIQFRVDASPTGETVRQVAHNIRQIRELAETHLADGPTVVHFEQAGASLTPFWGAMLPDRIPVTATIHDPPQPVWWPFASRAIGRHRVLHHGLHYPMQFASNALQRRMCRGRVLLTLTSAGARETQIRFPAADVRAARIFIPRRPEAPALTRRPLAVGLFGYFYKAKGFQKVQQLRAQLDSDIEIVVAGRGTEALPPLPGVTVLGEVNGDEEDRFFERIRFLLAPYDKGTRYGPVYAASSAIARSHSYGTPVICSLDGALPEIVSEGGALGVGGEIGDFAKRANAAIADEQLLTLLASEVGWLRTDRTVANCAAPFLQAWAELAGNLSGAG